MVAFSLFEIKMSYNVNEPSKFLAVILPAIGSV